MSKKLDQLLDLFCSGMSPSEVAVEMGEPPDKIKEKMKLCFTDAEFCRSYKPEDREPRKGKLNANEMKLVENHQKIALHPMITARILCRSEREIPPVVRHVDLVKTPYHTIIPVVEFLQALSICWNIYKIELVPNKLFDDWKAEAAEFAPHGNELKKSVDAYSKRAKSLALYLAELVETKQTP